MGLHPQPNDWTCGPFALKHALVALGKLVDATKLAKQAGTHWWSGTDEIALARVARRYDVDLELVRTRDPNNARRLLSEYLSERIPVLLCVDDWGHWITVVHRSASSFVVLDSDLDPVMNVLTWSQLRRRWRYYDVDYDEDEPPELYDMYPAEPRRHAKLIADFSIRRVRHLRRPENRVLATYWNTYLEDLLELCRPPDGRVAGHVTMAEFLRRNQEVVLRRVVFWHGDIRREVVAKLLRDFRFVAETYGLVIPKAQTRTALVDLVVLATMWAIARAGAVEMYGYRDENG